MKRGRSALRSWCDFYNFAVCEHFMRPITTGLEPIGNAACFGGKKHICKNTARQTVVHACNPLTLPHTTHIDNYLCLPRPHHRRRLLIYTTTTPPVRQWYATLTSAILYMYHPVQSIHNTVALLLPLAVSHQATATTSQITLRGSTEIVTEFFGMCGVGEQHSPFVSACARE